MTSTLRRGFSLIGILLLGVTVGALSIVPPSAERAVVAVSRFGDSVRLLPQRLALSPLPLARRVVLERRAGAAVLEVRVDAALPGGASIPVRYQIRVAGAGVLPLQADSVRSLGWEGAWSQWLERQEPLRGEEVSALVHSSPLWRRIFPTAPAVATPDLTARLAPALPGLRVAGVEVSVAGAEDVVRALARRELTGLARPRGRLVVLGLDALDWALVDQLIARGLMPNTAALMRRGFHAVLEVPRPLISPVVWTTIATGVPPEVHGVLDFLESDPAGGPPRPVTAASRKATAIWEMMAAAGRSTAVIGWWASFPAQAPPGGAVYSDRLTEQLLGLAADVPGMADPPQAALRAKELLLRANDVTPAMLQPFLEVSAEELAAAVARPDAWDDPIGGLAKLAAASFTVERITALELQRGTDVVFSYLEGTDTVGHLYGPYRPPVLPGFDGPVARRFGAVVDRYYAWTDRWVGAVAASLTKDDTIVLVSDHGFTWGDDRPRVPSGAHTATAEMWHRPYGAFLAAGPLIPPSRQRHTMGVLDVAPSLMALAGLPRAEEMPGRVPQELLPEAVRVPGVVNYAALVPRKAPEPVELPAAAREEEIAKLRALGYLVGSSTPSQPAVAPAAAAPPLPVPPAPVGDRAEARRLSNLAISQASAGDVRQAEQTFRMAIAADPSYSSAHYSLSVLLRKQGRLEEADAAFWTSVRLGVRDRDMAVVRLALDYRQRGMPDKAEEVFAEGRRILPDSALVWLNSGVYLGEQGRFEEAARYLQRAAQLDPSKPTAFKNLGVALLNLGDREGARAALTRAAALDPTDEAVRAQLAALGGPLPRE
jgi:Tfp pilus assembly protein PilF